MFPNFKSAVQGEVIKTVVRNDYILEVHTRNMVYSRQDVEKAVQTIQKVVGNTQHLVLIIADKGSRIRSSAIRMLFGKEANSYAVAKAYVVQYEPLLWFSRVLSSLLFRQHPIRFFSNRDEAEKWLRLQIELMSRKD